MSERIRNIAIIAHVDHGKTTLVDKLLQQSGTLVGRSGSPERVLDSDDLEKERGITIVAKNTALRWRDYRINIVDTPGHADFGGEVERILSMVDAVLLLVDAVDGPMPQTRFVTRKAFAHRLKPIVVINKIDRPGARPEWVLNQTFDLFDRLGATEEQLDFPVLYTSALHGTATVDLKRPGTDLAPLFDTVVAHTPAPPVDIGGPFQMQITALDYSSYVGAIGIGRVRRGRVVPNSPVMVIGTSGEMRPGRVLQVLGFMGLERVEMERAAAGDIVAVTGLGKVDISDTLCDPEALEALPPLKVDEPTITMTFEVNTSPFAGRDGRFVTSRHLRERLHREALHNVALRVADTDDPEKFVVSGRGELHLAIFLENMRRQGYELAVSRPQVIVRDTEGLREEPYEHLTVDVEEPHRGAVMAALGERRGELKDVAADGRGRVRLDYVIPARGLIGFQTEFMGLTSGGGLMHHVFDHYGPLAAGELAKRRHGVLVSMATGKTLAYALFNLQERGRLLVSPGEGVYEGQVVGMHSRANDLTVNPLKAKQLTNIRAAAKDDNVLLKPPLPVTLELGLELIGDDELLEITPRHLRIRKRFLKEHERRRARRSA